MGGTMEYARIRARNGLNDRRMVGDPYFVAENRTDGTQTYEKGRTLTTDYLQGEMNRMEQSYMGDYGGLTHLPDQGAAVTGLTREQVLSVMRWFFGLPEPGCDECAKTTHPTNQRCVAHQTGEGLADPTDSTQKGNR